jgi:hypothetical protein
LVCYILPLLHEQVCVYKSHCPIWRDASCQHSASPGSLHRGVNDNSSHQQTFHVLNQTQQQSNTTRQKGTCSKQRTEIISSPGFRASTFPSSVSTSSSHSGRLPPPCHHANRHPASEREEVASKRPHRLHQTISRPKRTRRPRLSRTHRSTM